MPKYLYLKMIIMNFYKSKDNSENRQSNYEEEENQ